MSLGHVRGLLRTETASSAPASPSTGQIYYDTTTLSFKYYDGANWYDMDTAGASIPTTGLEIWLDANDPSSYSGSGTVWSDISGNGVNFNVPSAAFVAAAGSVPAYFNFSTNGYIANNYPTDVSTYSKATVVVFTKVRNTTIDYRTLLRGASNDHQVILDSGTWDLGYFNNPSSPGFQDSGYNLNAYPQTTTDFIMHTYRFATTNDATYGYWAFNINAIVGSSGTITSSNATYDNGFCCIGGYHNNSSSTTGGIQQWGDVSAFLYYSRHLSAVEQESIYLSYKSTMGI